METALAFVKRHTIWLLIGITFLVYIPSFFGDFLWDDEDLVYANQYVKDFRIKDFFTESANAGRGGVSNYYRPLQLITYAIEHKLFGFTPWVYHVSNVIWHIAAGIMVYIVLRSVRVPWALAFGSSLIFLLHPIQTEAVSYISGRSDMICMVFILLSFIYSKAEERVPYTLSLIFLLLALFSKESALLALVIFPVLHLMYYGFSNKLMYLLRRLIPHLLIALVYVLLRFTVLEFIPTIETWDKSIYTASVWVRMATFFRNYFFYWQVLLFPYHLHMERDASTVRIIPSLLSIWTVWFVCIQVFCVGVLVWLYKKHQQYGLIALSGYLGMHAVIGFYSGMILLNGIFYEHYLYSALPFSALFLGAFIIYMKSYYRNMILALIGIWFIAFGFIYNIKRQIAWSNPVSFFIDASRYAPNNIRVINGLGIAYVHEGDYYRAIETFDKGIALYSSFPNFYHNKGKIYQVQNKYVEAERQYFKALELNPYYMLSIKELITIAEIYVSKNNLPKALSLYNKMILFVSPGSVAYIQVKNRTDELEKRAN